VLYKLAASLPGDYALAEVQFDDENLSAGTESQVELLKPGSVGTETAGCVIPIAGTWYMTPDLYLSVLTKHTHAGTLDVALYAYIQRVA
jgi:hypothetical protein